MEGTSWRGYMSQLLFIIIIIASALSSEQHKRLAHNDVAKYIKISRLSLK